MDKVLASNIDITGEIAEILRNYGSDNMIDITILEDNTIKSEETGLPVAGETSKMRVANNIYNATIKINSDFFLDTSGESVATTFIHEVVHSYTKYIGLSDEAQDHSYLASNYVDPMAYYLQSKFNITLLQGYALAWSGLGNSDAMKKATDSSIFKMKDGTEFTKGDIISQSSVFNFKGEGAIGTPLCN